MSCTGAMWDVASSNRSIASSVWAVTASIFDTHALCGMLQRLSRMF